MNVACHSALVFLFVSAAAFDNNLSTARAQDTTGIPDNRSANSDTNAFYLIDRFVVEYGPRGTTPHPELPPIADLADVQVELGQSGETYFAPEPGRTNVKLRLAEIQQPTRFSVGAIVAINQALARELNRRGYYAVWATPDPADLDPRTGEDLRDGRQQLRLLVQAAEVQQLRTIAKGRRVPALQSTNHPAYRRIAENSPLQPPRDDARGSPLFKERLDDYVGRLNRFPGRSAAAALGPSDTPGGLALDYLVSEDRPWTAYAQVANTGTRASGDWRERFGFVHQQLTQRDDILSLDYVTADFEHSHAFFGSYEVPIVYPDRLKTKIFGSYAEFTADELGLFRLRLDGSQWSSGGELTLSSFSFAGPNKLRGFKFERFYFDLSAGARWEGIEVNNEIFGEAAGTDLFLPYLGLTLSSISKESKLFAGVQFEGNIADIADTRSSDLPNLGRLATDKDWLLAKWGMGFSFFMEPFFESHPEKLVHELSFSSQGQYVFGDRRLIPQQTALIGGMYSVRGYPESFDLGDTVFIGTAEYRFYIARALMPAIDEKRLVGAKTTGRTQFTNPFRFRSRDAYSRPNWDVVLRAFLDGGKTYNNRRRPTETDRNLLSTGVGLDFQLWRNLSVRADYGISLLSEKENLARRVDSGDSRAHFSATVSW